MPRDAPASTPAWQQAQERSTPWMLSIIVWIARHLGRNIARLLLFPISVYFLLTGASARRASRSFLNRALSRPARTRDVLRLFHKFAACSLDRIFLLTNRLNGIHIQRHAQNDVVSSITDGGCLLLASHLGSFEVLRVFAKSHYAPRFRLVMDRNQAPMITAALERLNPQMAEDIIDNDSGPALGLILKEALNQQCVVGMMADRLTGSDIGVEVPFMGKPARLPTVPWQWAAVLGVPILLCFGIYRGGQNYDLYLELFSEAHAPVPRSQRRQYVQACAERYAARLEAHARLAPYNWFNFYNFWSDESAGN